jgi:hypothetical protein
VAATAISCGCDSSSAGSSIDVADEPGEDGCLLRGERAVQDGGGDQRQGPEQPGGPQLSSGRAGGAVLEVGEPAGGGAGPAVRIGDGPAGELVELPGGGGEPAVQPGDQRGDGRDHRLQLGDVQLLEGFGEQGVDQRCQGRSGRRHAHNLSAGSDRSRR